MESTNQTPSNTTESVSYTINSDNYLQGIPHNVSTFVLSHNLNQSLDKEIFRAFDDHESSIHTIHVTLSNSVTNIEDRAFNHCNMIKSMTLIPVGLILKLSI